MQYSRLSYFKHVELSHIHFLKYEIARNKNIVRGLFDKSGKFPRGGATINFVGHNLKVSLLKPLDTPYFP